MNGGRAIIVGCSSKWTARDSKGPASHQRLLRALLALEQLRREIPPIRAVSELQLPDLRHRAVQFVGILGPCILGCVIGTNAFTGMRRRTKSIPKWAFLTMVGSRPETRREAGERRHPAIAPATPWRREPASRRPRRNPAPRAATSKAPRGE